MKKIFVDRSRTQTYDRCKRLRWIEYHSGSAGRGVVPVRKSIHLVLGGAVHVGLEGLLRDSERWLANFRLDYQPSREAKIQILFEGLTETEFGATTNIRLIENAAVAATLVDLAESTRFGVELDEIEKSSGQQQAPVRAADGQPAEQSSFVVDSPIVIDFGDDGSLDGLTLLDHHTGGYTSPKTSTEILNEQLQASIDLPVEDWGKTIHIEPRRHKPEEYSAASDDRLTQIEVANSKAAAGIDDYLIEELKAQVEAMVRAYARRRLRPLLEQFEVLEVEREGEWKLAEIDGKVCDCFGMVAGDHDPSCQTIKDTVDIMFVSRLDALLLERSTGQLYLQSYKTTGNWDRRKEADAQIDMQGLTEAVDVDNRMAQAWHLREARDLVNHRTAKWLSTLPEPPTVLGVRYEYLLKGPRRADKKDLDVPNRYVADTPLIRAYMQEGITGDDRKWATSYEWFDAAGKPKRLDYRSWRKRPVWRYMTIAKWIDMLDRGEVQPEAQDENSLVIDTLAQQFIPPVTVFRNEDDMRDMLEQIEAKEVRVAEDVAAVKARGNDQARVRSELNKRFPQSRISCLYPGRCSGFDICYGSADMRANPEASGLYQIRIPNHPQENEA